MVFKCSLRKLKKVICKMLYVTISCISHLFGENKHGDMTTLKQGSKCLYTMVF